MGKSFKFGNYMAVDRGISNLPEVVGQLSNNEIVKTI